jgi:hypothetical protein
MKHNLFSTVTLHPPEAAPSEILIPPGQETISLGPVTARLERSGDSHNLQVESTDGTPLTHGLCWEFEGWSEEVYAFLPAGAYAGNRFPSVSMPYSPRIPEDRVLGPRTEPIITDVPRLTHEPGPSRLQLCTGDLAFPALGWFDPRDQKAWLVLARNPSGASTWLWEIEENTPRDRARFRISTPALRNSPVYFIPRMLRPSPDQVPPSAKGDLHCIDVQVVEWSCPDLPSFFEKIFSLREELRNNQPQPATLPFSTSFSLIEEHYNRDSWREDLGIYTTDCSEGSAYPFQTGWCGGMIATEALLASSSSTTRARVMRNLEVFFAGAPRPCGLFFGKRRSDGLWTPEYAHDTARPYTHQWTLVRRQGDALFYLLRQIALLEAGGDFTAPGAWDETLRRCAHFFCKLWQKEGQFGQFLHQETGEILVGGSTSGAIVPAALLLAWKRYQEPTFLETALAAGHYFAEAFLAKGFTTGGPGDACQNPDSESVAALVESYAALYDTTGDKVWLEHGTAAAAQASTWVMPYNFPFPPASEFGRLKIATRGSVFANTQNKHSAPGICTHAGEGLLRLFRATGDLRLLDLITEIARFIPQTISRADQPIHSNDGRPLPSGWINERVNTSDWDDNVGGVFFGSCWCEVSMLLTVTSLPGVYAQPDSGLIRCLDHIEAAWVDGEQSALCLHNPTRFDARVRVMCETSIDTATTLPLHFAAQLPMVTIPAGGEIIFSLR